MCGLLQETATQERSNEPTPHNNATDYDTLRHTARHKTGVTNPHRITIQYTATHCDTLQDTRPHVHAEGASTAIVQQTATNYNRLYELQQTATDCNRLQQTATHLNFEGASHYHCATDCNRLQQTATHCNTLQQTATHCNTLQQTYTLRA